MRCGSISLDINELHSVTWVPVIQRTADYMLFYPFYIFACMLYLFINVSVYKSNVSSGYK
jgi:hypothetical protein